MHRFKAPAKPASFDADMRKHRKRTAARIKARRAPTFPELWKDYKAEFSAAQFTKCGYCEIFVIAGQPGDVEHFCPKGAVWELTAEGTQVPDLAKVKGRTHTVLSPRGYWWKAYEWDNYLLACNVCNRTYKGSYFPVKAKKRRLPPSKKGVEQSFLLHPFVGPHPTKHLKFGNFGAVEPRMMNGRKSRIGFETIRTYGLHREPLRLSREEKAKKAHQLARDYLAAKRKSDENRILKDFREMGQPQNHHCGMVRAIFEHECGMSWSALEQIVAALP